MSRYVGMKSRRYFNGREYRIETHVIPPQYTSRPCARIYVGVATKQYQLPDCPVVNYGHRTIRWTYS